MTDERALLERTAEIAARYLETLDARHVGPVADYGAMLAAVDREVPEEGIDAADVVDELAATRRARADGDGLRPLLRLRHRRHAPVVSFAADWLVSAWDQNTGLAQGTPAVAALEAVTGELGARASRPPPRLPRLRS